jgi:type I restriction enzyme M protein
MAIKKSELYSSLWASCDELRGGMDASQYKDYVLVMLFIKYISDKYAGIKYSPIEIPQGSSFDDMIALKGDVNIGEKINTQIIAPIAEKNKLSEMPDFDDPNKLGQGKDKVERLTNLISIFQNPALNFKGNQAEGDDILGDAYEYLMRHFATESGKSKGQFYTPAEVSRVIAKIIGINYKNTTAQTSVYDPTCGSGSLLLKVADEAEKPISVFGQEMDNATSALARMNMILHNNPTADIRGGRSTLSTPLFLDENSKLKTFNFIVANPPFSYKSWSNGVNSEEEAKESGRFYGYGTPPSKNGDYAFLLHILKSLKTTGKAAVILPHGVLFRGNSEGVIRKNLIRKGVIKGIIGLPANLFYGTGIPACIIVIDKEDADNRKGIFMIDASKGFEKDGNKNRLRQQDIHKIVDVFNKKIELPKYSRMVSITEIEEKEFNLNIPRYIDSTEIEDIQNIEAHLCGGIPNPDIAALENYWEVYPTLKNHLFEKSERENFSTLKIAKDEIKQTIFSHREFISYSNKVSEVFEKWKSKNIEACKAINEQTKPKKFIHDLSEDLLDAFSNLKLIDKYDVYQHLMSYWAQTMQDDCYLLVANGFKAETRRIIEKNKAGKQVDKGWICDLLPKSIVINRYFKAAQSEIENLETAIESLASQIAEIEEENNGDEGVFANLDKISKTSVSAELKALKDELKSDKNNQELLDKQEICEKYLKLCEDQSDLSKKLKEESAKLDCDLLEKFKKLTAEEVKILVVEDKWMATIEHTIKNEMQRISQRVNQRIKELAERYEKTLPEILNSVNDWEAKVNTHLKNMGFKWGE